MMLVNYTPFRNFRSLQHEINHLFEQTGEESPNMTSQWPLRVDIREDANSVILQADIPGIEQKDIKVHVEDNKLTLSGERLFEDEQEREAYHRVERAYGQFNRTFQLGESTDVEKIQAAYQNGVLTITLPKRDEAKPRSIEVTVQ